jgi:uncharacterized membrane protein YcjF (UPF0283 family)
MQQEIVMTPCDYARDRHQNLARWRNLWTMLLFLFGAVVILFSAGAILLFIRESWLPGAITTAGTVVTGVGVAWVVTRRREAVDEEEEAYKDVIAQCGSPAPADAVRERFAVFRHIR